VNFDQAIINWQQQFGRHDLPWQNSQDPYRIWVSEIMLQQTQVSTVLGYYERFLARFPTVSTLANAPQDAVLALWAGLGYYSRARNLHRAAQLIHEQLGGRFPAEQAALMALPGIGRSTAAAILAFSAGQATPILDGNVKRVFSRVFGVKGDPGTKPVIDALWHIAERQMPTEGVISYTQGLMDLGATLCTRSKPRCTECPVSALCFANANDLQSVLPQRKQKTQIPIRVQVFVIVRAGQQVLLQRQPETGIWGGLYSLPRLLETVPEKTGKASSQWAKAFAGVGAAQRRVALQDPQWLEAAASWFTTYLSQRGATNRIPTAVQFGPSFTHAFTHYKLLGYCVELILPTQSSDADFATAKAVRSVDTERWFDTISVLTVGLPKPIANLGLFDPADIG
jgi:A/G-specific adenine glycosylase